jgi:L-lactate dehydrogenase complex protein LldG
VFIERLHELGVKAAVVCSLQGARSSQEILAIEGAWSRVACAPSLKWPGISDKWTADAGEASFGFCEADWAVAETGSVVVTSRAEVRRGYSLSPSAVGFFVSDDCIRATVGDVLRELAGLEKRIPSCISFVSGPSSTADIASVHVVGVHGPREVYVWVIASAG